MKPATLATKSARRTAAPQSPKKRVWAAADVIAQIRRGLKFEELELLRSKVEISMEELAEKLSISRSTLHRRKSEGRLNPDESDKVVRFSRLLGQATRVLGGLPDARAWLKFPQRGLAGAVPLEYARTEVGAREVEDLLGRIDYGVYS